LDSISERELVEGIQHGSQDALAAAYEQYSDGVFAYCLRILADRQLAEDVVQDTFLKVRHYAASLQQDDSFRSWIFRIARNEVLMQLRETRRNSELVTESPWETETPHEQFISAERTEIVNRSLDYLKREYREVLVLRIYENLSYAEIASITGTTESSVKSRIFRARKAMMEKLRPYVQE
jgi:RNA polymerase sigma-70 factor (ECF subfamily)